MADDTLNQLLAAIGIQNKQVAAQSQTVQDMLAQQQTIQQDAIKQTVIAGESGKAGLQVAELAALKAQEHSSNFAAHLGTNPDSATYIMNDLADKWRESQSESLAAKQSLVDKTSVKFSDNPAKWLINQLTLGDDITAVDAASAKEAQIKGALSFAQQATQSQVATNNAIAATRTAGSVQAKLDEAQAQVNLNVDRQKILNVGQNISGIMNLNQLSMEQIQLLGTANTARKQDEQFKFQKQEFDMRRQEMAMRVKEFSIRLEEKQATTDQMQSLASLTQAGLSALGYKEQAVFPSTKVLALLKSGVPLYKQALEIGMNVASAPAGYPAISDSAGKLASLIEQTGAPLQATDKDIRNLLLSAQHSAKTPAPGKTYDVNKPEQVQAEVDKLIEGETNKMLGNVMAGGKSNIYAPQPLPVVLSANQAIANSNYVRTVLAPQMAAGAMQEFNPDQIIGLTKNAIREGKIKLDATTIKEMTGVFIAATQQNNTVYAYRGKGLQPQQTFNILSETGVFGSMNKYDMTKTTDVGRLLMKSLYQEQWGSSQAITPAGYHD